MFPGACLLAAATLVGAYSNSFQNSFQYDDGNVIQNNLYIRSLKNIPLFFRDASTYTSFPSNGNYRPLVSTTLALDYWMGGGLDVRQFHLSQLTMLTMLGALVCFMFSRLLDLAATHWWNRYVALLAAALFAVHTTNTETMNIIQVRSELLAALAVAGSFLVYFSGPRRRRAHLYLLPMIAGAFAKPTAVLFAPLFLVYLLLFEERLSLPDLFASRSRAGVWSALLKALPALAAGVAAFLFTNAMNPRTYVSSSYDRTEYLITQSFAWLHYGRLFFVPAGLSVDNAWPVIPGWYDTRVIAGAAFVALLLHVMWRSSQTPASRPVAFGIAWFGIGLLPASSVIPLTSIVTDHRTFFPNIGLSLAVVWGLALLARRWFELQPRLRPVVAPAACAVAVLAVAGHASGTYERNKAFLSRETLWRDVTEKNPVNGRGWIEYGLAQLELGKLAEARQLFERAKVYEPNHAALEVNLGIVAARLGDMAAAGPHFERAVQLTPGDPPVHAYYGSWLMLQERLDAAISHLQIAVSRGPADPSARYELLEAYARAGRTSDLKALAADTLAVLPGDPRVSRYFNDRGDVVAPVRPAPAAAPGVESAEALLSASLRRYQAGDFPGSIDAAKRALQRKPDSAEAYNNIAASLASLRQWDEAIEAAHQALRLKPDFPLARNNLAWAEGEKERATRPIASPSVR